MVPAVDVYSPEPNVLERRFAGYLAQRGASDPAGGHPSRDCAQAIGRVARWTIGLAALAGVISGTLIGGGEIWMRREFLAGMENDGWRQTWPYWAAFYAGVGVVSVVEIALLYALALTGIARIARHAGLPLKRGRHQDGGHQEGGDQDGEGRQGTGRGLFSHALARTALEFPSPQVMVYGIDPYAQVSKWKLMALNIGYKLKVGISSFLLRVFLRRVAARMAIRGMVPLFAAPLYAAWNAYIIWRMMTEARVRTLGPFAVDGLLGAQFANAADLNDTERDVALHAAGEMMTRGRDAHPNQIYLMARLRAVLGHEGDVTLDWEDTRHCLPGLDAAGQTRVLDLLTVSCLIGTRMRRAQTTLLRNACAACGAELDSDRLRGLRRALVRGDPVTAADLSATRQAADVATP